MIDWTKERSGGKNYCGYCTGTPADGTATCNGECFKESSPNFKENREDQIKRKIHFHKYMLARYEFDKQDWASFHDALYNATYDDAASEGKNFTQDELEAFFMTFQIICNTRHSYGVWVILGGEKIYMIGAKKI